MAFRGEEKRWPVRRWLSSCPQSPPDLPPPLGSCRVRMGLEGKGLTLTVPSCPCGPAAACDAAASSSSWGRAGGCGVTVGVEGPAAPGPACLCPRRLSRPGWVGGALRFLGQPRSRCSSLSPPPLATPPPAPRSLLSPSLFSRSFASSGPPKGAPPTVPASVGLPAAWRSTGCARGPSSPLLPAQPRWREAGKPVPATAPARLPGFLPHPPACKPWV